MHVRVLRLPALAAWLLSPAAWAIAAEAPPDQPVTADNSVVAPAAAPAGASDDGESVFQHLRSWSDERLRALYENIIVDAQHRHKFGAKPQPHFGDLIHADYTRLDLRWFYGFAEKIEGEVNVGNYFPSPRHGGDRYGFDEVDLVGRYRWVPHADPTGKATSGIELDHPITGSPDDLTDGVNRYTAFCSYARTSTRIKNFQEFFSLSYSVITPAGARGILADDEPQNDFVSGSIGMLRNVGPLTYGLTLGWEHVTDGQPVDFVTVTPTVMFGIPGRYFFGAPGEFQLGGSVECKRYRDISEFNFNIRVRWYVKLKEVLHGWNRPALKPS